MGQLEVAANVEYERGRYDPFKGGPALARLNAFRHDKRLTKPPRTPTTTDTREMTASKPKSFSQRSKHVDCDCSECRPWTT